MDGWLAQLIGSTALAQEMVRCEGNMCYTASDCETLTYAKELSTGIASMSLEIDRLRSFLGIGERGFHESVVGAQKFRARELR